MHLPPLHLPSLTMPSLQVPAVRMPSLRMPSLSTLPVPPVATAPRHRSPAVALRKFIVARLVWAVVWTGLFAGAAAFMAPSPASVGPAEHGVPVEEQPVVNLDLGTGD